MEKAKQYGMTIIELLLSFYQEEKTENFTLLFLNIMNLKTKKSIYLVWQVVHIYIYVYIFLKTCACIAAPYVCSSILFSYLYFHQEVYSID